MPIFFFNPVRFIKYTMYTMYMSSTIRLSPATKKLISTFGLKGESFETIVKRLYSIAVKQKLSEFLMPSNRYLSIDEARERIEKKWPRSK